MWTSSLYGERIIGFFKIFLHGQGERGIEPVRTFFGQGGKGESIFRDFVWTSFKDGPLIQH